MSWNWFHVLYSMAAIFMVINFVWRFAVIPSVLVSLAFNEAVQKIILFILMIVPYYLMASFALLVCLAENDGMPSTFLLVLGGLFLLLSAGMGIAPQQNEAERSFNLTEARMHGLKYYALLVGLVYYVYAIIDHRPAFTNPVFWLNDLLLWVQGVKILNIVIAIMAFLYVIYMLFVSLVAVGGIIAAIVSIFTKKKLSA